MVAESLHRSSRWEVAHSVDSSVCKLEEVCTSKYKDVLESPHDIKCKVTQACERCCGYSGCYTN